MAKRRFFGPTGQDWRNCLGRTSNIAFTRIPNHRSSSYHAFLVTQFRRFVASRSGDLAFAFCEDIQAFCASSLPDSRRRQAEQIVRMYLQRQDAGSKHAISRVVTAGSIGSLVAENLGGNPIKTAVLIPPVAVVGVGPSAGGANKGGGDGPMPVPVPSERPTRVEPGHRPATAAAAGASSLDPAVAALPGTDVMEPGGAADSTSSASGLARVVSSKGSRVRYPVPHGGRMLLLAAKPPASSSVEVWASAPKPGMRGIPRVFPSGQHSEVFSSEPIPSMSQLRLRTSAAWSVDPDAGAAARAEVQDRLTRLRMMYWPGVDGGVAVRARVVDGGKGLIRRMAAVYGRGNGGVGVGGALCDVIVALVRAERHMRALAALRFANASAGLDATCRVGETSAEPGIPPTVPRANANSEVGSGATATLTTHSSRGAISGLDPGVSKRVVMDAEASSSDPGSWAKPESAGQSTHRSDAAALGQTAAPLAKAEITLVDALASARATWSAELDVVGVSSMLSPFFGLTTGYDPKRAIPSSSTPSSLASQARASTRVEQLARSTSQPRGHSCTTYPAIPGAVVSRAMSVASAQQPAFTDDASGGLARHHHDDDVIEDSARATLVTADSAVVTEAGVCSRAHSRASDDAKAAAASAGAYSFGRLQSPEVLASPGCMIAHPRVYSAAEVAAAAISDSGCTTSATVAVSRSRNPTQQPGSTDNAGFGVSRSRQPSQQQPPSTEDADSEYGDDHEASSGQLQRCGNSSGVRGGRVRSAAVMKPHQLCTRESPELVAASNAARHSPLRPRPDHAGDGDAGKENDASAAVPAAPGPTGTSSSSSGQEHLTHPSGPAHTQPAASASPADGETSRPPRQPGSPAGLQRSRSRSFQGDGKGAISDSRTALHSNHGTNGEFSVTSRRYATGAYASHARAAGASEPHGSRNVPAADMMRGRNPVDASTMSSHSSHRGLALLSAGRAFATGNSDLSRCLRRPTDALMSDDDSSSLFTYTQTATRDGSEGDALASSPKRAGQTRSHSSPSGRALRTSEAASVLDKLRADARMLFRSLSAVPKGCPCIPIVMNAARDSLTEGLRPDLFDLVACIALEVQRRLYWQSFVASPEFTSLKQHLTLQRDTPSASAFVTLRILGRGGFGAVSACKKADTGRLYAMKVMDKRHVHAKRAESLVLNERVILAKARSPFVVGLRYSFQTATNLVLVQDLMVGGDLAFHISKAADHCLDEARARFYTAQLVLGLEHLHAQRIVYRDLKPDNVLMDAIGNVALADLGLATILPRSGVTSGRCGTRGYWAPEMIHKPAGVRQKYGFAVDWWSLGCVVYEMLHGVCPFRSAQAREFDPTDRHRAMDLATLYMTIGCDAGKASAAAQDLIAKLLNRDPAARLGARGAAEVREHPWFEGVDWGGLQFGQVRPPFTPEPTINAASQSAIGEFEEIGFAGVGVDQTLYETWEATMPEAFQMEMAEFLLWKEYFGEPVVEPGFNSCCTVL